MLTDDRLIHEIEALGVARDVDGASCLISATFAHFFYGTLNASGEPCFIKVTAEAVEEIYDEYPRELEGVLAGARYARSVHVHHIARLSEGSRVIFLNRVRGVTLQDIIDRKTEISESGKRVIASALLEFAEAFGRCSFTHRDVCAKNLVFDAVDETLTLIDFDAAVRTGVVSVWNPSIPVIRNHLLLNYGYYPAPGVWNDVYSLVKVHEKVLSKSNETLLRLSSDAGTSTVEFDGDDAWRKRMRFEYLKLSIRPLWTHKENSRFKKAALLNALRQITHGTGKVMKKEPISLSFSASDNFSQHLAVCIASFVANTPHRDFVVHILQCNISDENKTKLKALEHLHTNCRIVIHDVDPSMFDGFQLPEDLHLTKEMYFRYVLPNILRDEKRTLYSDVDVLAVGSIEELWELSLEGKCLGAMLEKKENTETFQRHKMRLGMRADTPYYYSGFLLMDLERIREKNLVPKLFENTWKYNGFLSWPDQDIINTTFMGEIFPIANIWNCTDKYSPFRQDVKTWHFPGVVRKPWCNIWKNNSWPLYFKYLLKSPYRANALKFLLDRINGFLYFKYVKKGVERTLVCGILVRKRRVI